MALQHQGVTTCRPLNWDTCLQTLKTAIQEKEHSLSSLIKRQIFGFHSQLTLHRCNFFYGTLEKTNLLSFQEEVANFHIHPASSHLPGEGGALNQVRAGIQHTAGSQAIAQESPNSCDSFAQEASQGSDTDEVMSGIWATSEPQF